VISSYDKLLSLLEQTIRKHRLFEPDDTIIVAISGGADSTALLDLLVRLPGYNLRLVAAHLNHCLRGCDSDADEEFCSKLAARYTVAFESRRIDVRGVAESGALNLEDAGRRVRIAFLDELRKKHGALAVAVAHHADDQAETLLMRLLRGSGMTGLSGMAYRNSRGYIRPLLEISRSEIEQYLRGHCLDWREDASNSDKTYLRNRIRHDLLPILETYNPAIRSSLAKTASIIRDDETLLDELTEGEFSGSCRVEVGKIVCNAGQLRTLEIALRRRILRHAFKQLTGTLEGVSQSHIVSICDMIDSDRPNSRLYLPQRVTAVREYDRLLFSQTDESVHERFPELLISKPGYYPFLTGCSLTIEISKPPSGFNTLSANTAFFDLDKVPFPWLLRTFRPGDRIIPIGMSGRKKVKDFFIDEKIPLSERKRVPLLFCGDQLIWLVGLRSSDLARVDMGTDNIAKVTCTKLLTLEL
jgi:tRNA(Ile)-lysidine synthase